MTTAADGSWNITIVDGLTYVGKYAADGSFNCFQVTGGSLTTPQGWNHPSGAINIVNATAEANPVGIYHACGAMNVSTNAAPTTPVGATAPNGARYVTVVAGVLA